jgi:hypothetical protein
MSNRILSVFALAAIGTASAALAAPRDVQFQCVDFSTNVFEVRNFGDEAQALNGFRFCTSSSMQVRVYTLAAALNGLTLQPGDSLFVYLNNDAPMGDPLRRNASSIGNFAPGFGPSTPYGLSFYSPPIGFANPDSMVDHLMWSVDGVANTQAATRAGVAVTAGLWTSNTAFISTQADTTKITLLDASGGLLLHGPSDYEVAGPVGDCPGDSNGDNTVNFTDLNSVLSSFGQSGPGVPGDVNGDEVVNFSDLNEVLSNFGTTCE